jgi:hypothetical protein
VNQDGHRKPKTGKNFLKFLSIGVILQHVRDITRGNIHEKFDVKPLDTVAPVFNGEVQRLVSGKETILQVKRKGSKGTKFHIKVTGCSTIDSLAMIGFQMESGSPMMNIQWASLLLEGTTTPQKSLNSALYSDSHRRMPLVR